MEGLIFLVICAFLIALYIYRKSQNKWIAEQERNGGYFLVLIKDEEEIHYSEYFETQKEVIDFVSKTEYKYDITFKEWK